MKKLVKIIIIVLILFIVLLFVAPIFFKGKILNLIKEEANKNIKATLNFSDVSLSLIKNFPDLTLELKDLSITGKEEFEGDTLVGTKNFLTTINLFSIFSEQIKVKKIIIEQPLINLLVTKSGKANWDITIEDTISTNEPEDTTSAFKLSLKKLLVNNATLNYCDTSTAVYVKLDSLNIQTSGDLEEMITTLKNNITANSLTVLYEDMIVMKNTKVNIQSEIAADLNKYEFKLSNTKVLLNLFNIQLDGIVSMPYDDININLNFKNEKTDFKSFLSIIPAFYLKDFNDIQAKGNIEFNGFIKGIYNDSLMPGYNLNLKINNGYIKYNSLPSAISDINIDLVINNSNGNEDSTVINLKKLIALFDNTPLSASAYVSTPVSNPNFSGILKIASFNLSNIQKFYPIENTDISGLLNIDCIYSANMNDINNRNFNKVNAKGNINLSEFIYTDKLENKQYKIPQLTITLTPSYFELNNLKVLTQRSDFEMKGKILNFLGYLLNEQPLTAEFSLNSNTIDVNEFISSSETTPSQQTTNESDTISLTAPELPENIDFTFTTSVKKLIYAKTEFLDANLYLTLSEGKLKINNLQAKAFDGEIKMGLTYECKPNVRMDCFFDMKNVDVIQIDKSFEIFGKFMPFIKNSSGKINFTADMTTFLTKYLNPELNTLNAKGMISTKNFVIKNSALNSELLQKFDLKNFENITLTDLLLKFLIVNGNITIEKQKIKFNSYEAYFEGTQNVDLTCNYTITTSFPANIITDKIKSTLNVKGGDKFLPQQVPVNIRIYEKVNNPKVKVNFQNVQKEIIENVKEEIKEKVTEELNKAKKDALEKAQKEADKIIKEANEKARLLEEEADRAAKQIEQSGIEAANKIREEGELQAKKVEQQGGNNPITKKAAQESAKKIREEANKKANDVENKARQEAQNKRNQAKAEADKIRNEAQLKANKLIEDAKK